jgi:hypothetical protein
LQVRIMKLLVAAAALAAFVEALGAPLKWS